jgi:epoxyqueuosine reductase
MDSENLTSAIKAEAHRLGFGLVGVTSPESLPHADVFETWLDQGRQGEMGYLNSPRSRACRAHPERILPECCSIVVLGVQYLAPQQSNLDGGDHHRLEGKVAAYAWGLDYHEFLPARLAALVRFIESQVGQPIPNRYYTDTGPLLERELAQRAGLGWIGKNTCLINPNGGSYYLLAEILLDLELEQDLPFTADRCGTCSRCIQACPTGCILPDRTLDARRCISYLTIELKSSIPPDLRSLMDSWVFGCDVCQQVCPWNRFADCEHDPEFGQYLAGPTSNLLEEFTLNGGDFNRLYRHSPLRRAKRGGYLRNLAVALGNSHDQAAVNVLAQALLSDDEPLVREHAAWALGQLGGAAARQALESALKAEVDSMVNSEIQSALEAF